VWTLVIFIVAGGPSIVIDGFTSRDVCVEMGRLNVELVNPKARFRCDASAKSKSASSIQTAARSG
jgi:hypothetical protein